MIVVGVSSAVLIAILVVGGLAYAHDGITLLRRRRARAVRAKSLFRPPHEGADEPR